MLAQRGWVSHVAAATCMLLIAAQTPWVVGDDATARFTVKGWVQPPAGAGENFTRDTTVVLDGGVHIGFLTSDYKFEIQDLPSASYTLEVHNPDFEYPVLRVDVSTKFAGDVRVTFPDVVTGQVVKRLLYDQTHGLQLQPIRQIQHFQEREAWSIMSILMNPMLLMMLFPMIMMYVMPKMMDGMDPEEKEAFLKQQQTMTPTQQMPDLAGWLAGAGTDAASPASKAVKAKKTK